MAAGKVEIGAFRTYSEAHQQKTDAAAASSGGAKGAGGGGNQSIPLDKIEGMSFKLIKYRLWSALQ
jgi:COP9 signalosome complex subunit 5